MTLTERLLSAFRPQERALTPNQIFGTDWQDLTGTSGEKVDAKTAITLSAVWSAVRLLSQDVATLPFHAIETRGLDRLPVDPQPTWLSVPDRNDLNQTSIDYLSQLCVSLLIDGNAFVWVEPNIFRPANLMVLNPLTVDVRRAGDGSMSYHVTDLQRNPLRTLDSSQLLHIPWVRRPGELRGLSPVQVQEETIGRGLAAQEVSSRFFKQGALYGGFVEVPRDTDLSKEDVGKLLADIAQRHKGHRKSWLLGALTGGATFKETMAKPDDSQLLETERWIREQIGSAYGIPPFLMGSLEPGAVSYASTEQQGILYKQSAVRPISTRIERAHSRLLPDGQSMKFNLDGLLRADFKTRTEGYRELWNIGVLSADEIRAKEDMTPQDGGIGKTYWAPLNFAPAEQVINQPLPANPTGPRHIEPVPEAAHFSVNIGDGAIRSETPVTVNPAAITVEPSKAPDVHIENRVEPTPVTIDVAPTPVTVENRVEPTPVTVENRIPEQPAPIVNVEAAKEQRNQRATPQEVIVTRLPDRIHKAKRNAKGEIESSLEVDA